LPDEREVVCDDYFDLLRHGLRGDHSTALCLTILESVKFRLYPAPEPAKFASNWQRTWIHAPHAPAPGQLYTCPARDFSRHFVEVRRKAGVVLRIP
jgi:hypothetical protein